MAILGWRQMEGFGQNGAYWRGILQSQQRKVGNTSPFVCFVSGLFCVVWEVLTQQFTFDHTHRHSLTHSVSRLVCRWKFWPGNRTLMFVLGVWCLYSFFQGALWAGRWWYQVSSELFAVGIDHVLISSLMSAEKWEAVICEVLAFACEVVWL